MNWTASIIILWMPESFRKWIAMDQFLEYAEYVGNFYGIPQAVRG